VNEDKVSYRIAITISAYIRIFLAETPTDYSVLRSEMDATHTDLTVEEAERLLDELIDHHSDALAAALTNPMNADKFCELISIAIDQLNVNFTDETCKYYANI